MGSINIEQATIEINKQIELAKILIKDKQAFDLNRFPFLKQKVDFFLLENSKLAQNAVFSRFIEEPYNLNIFAVSLFGDEECKKILNQLFREFYFEYRFITYISKLLYFAAINFDKKTAKISNKELLILEKPTENDGDKTLLDKIVIFDHEIDLTSDTFEEYISDEKLFNVFKALTERQQTILYLAYVKEYKDIEIAKILGISQQAVSKTRKVALHSLKKQRG